MRACLSLFILCLLAITATISAEDWNQFRGASGNGKAPAELPLEFSESDGIAWKVPLAGKAWSSPVIWKKQIWVTNALPDGHKLWALCFDLETGKKIHDILVFDVAEPQFCIAKN
ncbi:MAG: quinonprotein alcohol dehydrogenase, partial [Planctomycetes bacterium]|nr:quinonprotein alcohol dehydrogenase [Planctomycetota bacterium]